MTKVQPVLPRSGGVINRTERLFRAVWRDTSALWSEFRLSIIAFLVVTVGGGYLYRELMLAAGYAPPPLIDMPYVMLSIMLFNPVVELPVEPQLIVFFYAMPLIGIYVIGRGALDFVRLFFNRGERRTAWDEAVASTYRRHVIVLGMGHVGIRVARTLVHMGFEVVGIDRSIDDSIEGELSELGIPVIVGDGGAALVLEKAGLDHARAIVLCTSNDHSNFEITLRIREINPSVRIVVRTWDEMFTPRLKEAMEVRSINASDLSAPVFAGAAVGLEIAQTFRFGEARFSVLRMSIAPDSFMVGKSLAELQNDYDMDIVLHTRAGESSVTVHPADSIVIHPHDILVLFASRARLSAIIARGNGTYAHSPEEWHDHVIIIGLGHVGLRVARNLMRLNVPVIAINQQPPDYAKAAMEELNIPIILGDGRNPEILKAASIHTARGIVLCTSSDHINMQLATIVREYNERMNIVIRMWDDIFTPKMKQALNIAGVISSSQLAAPVFAGEAVDVQIAQTFILNDVEYSMVRLTIAAGSLMDGRTVADVQDTCEVDIVLHERSEGIDVHPAADTLLEAGDTIIVFARHTRVTYLVEQNERAGVRG